MLFVARTRKPGEYAIRREVFTDAAERLIRSRGYEQMTVQAVLDEVGSSKGAFYHYFDSKEALLEAVVERIATGAREVVGPIVQDPETLADEKLQRLFLALGQWKTERRDLVLGLMDVWLSDANAVVRDKLRRTAMATLGPLFVEIVRQGRDEGSFTVASPDHSAQVLQSLFEGLGETARELLLARHGDAVEFDEVRRTFAAYEEATERVLGLEAGSFSFMNEGTLHVWYD